MKTTAKTNYEILVEQDKAAAKRVKFLYALISFLLIIAAFNL
jgi:hypothetical protein